MAPDAGHASVFPMSVQQESIWLDDQFVDGPSRFLVSWVHRLHGPVDVGAVQAALTAFVARHEVMRSALVFRDGRPVQVVHPPMPVPLVHKRVGPDGLEQAAREAVSIPIAIDEPPLLRAHLFEAGPDEFVLAVQQHYATTDYISMRVMDTEFSEFYRAHVEGRPPKLPGPAPRLGPYARKCANRPDGPAEIEALAYWAERLRGAPAESAFPTDRPRPGVMGSGGDRVPFLIGDELGRAVHELCRREGVTPDAFFTTVTGTLLGRLAGQRDVTIGTPVSLRNEPETENMVACLTGVVPLRQQIEPTTPFRNALTRADDTFREAVAHSSVPAARLARELSLVRSRSRFPLFQVLLSLTDPNESAHRGLRLPGIQSGSWYMPTVTAMFDAHFILIPTGDGYTGLLDYSTELFEKRTAERLAQRFLALVADAVARPERPLGELTVLPPAERELILDDWALGAPPGEAPLAHEAFAASAAKAPHVPAVVQDGRSMSYAELDAAADALARVLVARGHARRRIGIYLDRSPAMAVAVLAALKAGGCCVPLDPSYPAQRVAFMLRDSETGVVISRTGMTARFGMSAGTEVLYLDDLPPDTGEESHGPLPRAGGADLAYVVYTSGSTGLPKGVAMPHRSLANLVSWQCRRSGRETGAPTLQYAPLGFDVAFQELFSTWAAGGTLVLADEEARREPGRLLDLINEYAVSRVFLPYVVLQRLTEHAGAVSARCDSLRQVVSAGEQLYVTPAIRRFFGASAPDACLENQYGPAETHVVTALRLTGDPEAWPVRPGIGRPIDGARVYVLDERLAPVPSGVVGEICASGEPVARGYLRNPELTARKFVPDPFDASRLLYRTGDMGRFLPDGTLEFTGRRDSQVKVHGHRAELGEVESAVKSVPGIADAVVVMDGEGGDGKLVAYYVSSPDGPDQRELRDAVRERLPQYLCPALYLPIAAIPQTTTGKIDRGALPRTRAAAPPERTIPVAPLDPVQARIAEIFSQLLGIRPVGADDDFFGLGGDSLGAVRLVHRIHDEWGVRLTPGTVFTSSTVDGLAALVRTGVRDGTVQAVAEAAVLPGAEPRPAVPEGRQVFLTGATGFVGAFLLRDLLTRTDSTVHCLVRADSEIEGMARLRQALARYRLWDASFAARLRAVPGDLARPALGLRQPVFDALASGVDVVYHLGAEVDVTKPYADLRDVNVGGTVEVLRLAAAGRPSPMHHVSTVGVFPPVRPRIHPRDPLIPPDALRHGYAHSKWVAESTLREWTGEVPVSVYRPTRIVGDTRVRLGQTNDVMWLLLKGCVQAGLAPFDFNIAFDLVPVDHVSGAILALSGRAGPGIYHLASERLLPFGTAVARLRSYGYKLDDVPTEEWLDAIVGDPDNAAHPLHSLVAADAARGSAEGAVVFDASSTREALAGVNWLPPAEVGSDLFAGYLDAFVASRFLPVPSLPVPSLPAPSPGRQPDAD